MAIFKITHENKAVFGGEKFARNIRCEYQYTTAQIEALKPKMTHKFRVRDDDGITYFWGVSSDDSSFAPLDTVGAALGCTEIQYKNPITGKYETL